ncbi:hypothetical protein BaRGS_00020414 [Batillaria attramentaria]|uniref:Uncharacterized protein n=1 Tax=Batillaria attramentaria TaxID=370345 RepID=A0ABD0KNH7_9CAEN
MWMKPVRQHHNLTVYLPTPDQAGADNANILFAGDKSCAVWASDRPRDDKHEVKSRYSCQHPVNTRRQNKETRVWVASPLYTRALPGGSGRLSRDIDHVVLTTWPFVGGCRL